MPARERPFTHELLFGTLRLRGRMDHYLAAFSRRPLAELDPPVLAVLRLGAYQLLEMGSVPAYAAVSQSVELVKPLGKSTAGFVNGVLQALNRGHERVTFPVFQQDPRAHLSTWGSHPEWLVERWIERFGAADARVLVSANNATPELYIRPITMTATAAAEELAARGVATEAVQVPGHAAPLHALRISSAASALDVLRLVPAIVQDPAAGLVADAVAAPADAVVADLCAAPGGKAIAIAHAHSDRPVTVIACDVSPERLRRLRENVARVGGGRVHVVCADARSAPVAAADVVLVDAPCTGTGTLRRHPDGRWRVQPADLMALVRLQAEILRGAAQAVKRGGVLVYATCSLEREENEDQVASFLAGHPEFELEPVTAVPEPARSVTGYLSVTPQAFGFDGAFAARLRKR